MRVRGMDSGCGLLPDVGLTWCSKPDIAKPLGIVATALPLPGIGVRLEIQT